jgi:multicomponent Na+:H+ antiporter subunit E
LLANAITLTPGTITVNIDGNHFAVHCLDKSIAVGMDSSSFVKVITKLENLWIKD